MLSQARAEIAMAMLTTEGFGDSAEAVYLVKVKSLDYDAKWTGKHLSRRSWGL